MNKALTSLLTSSCSIPLISLNYLLNTSTSLQPPLFKDAVLEFHTSTFKASAPFSEELLLQAKSNANNSEDLSVAPLALLLIVHFIESNVIQTQTSDKAAAPSSSFNISALILALQPFNTPDNEEEDEDEDHVNIIHSLKYMRNHVLQANGSPSDPSAWYILSSVFPNIENLSSEMLIATLEEIKKSLENRVKFDSDTTKSNTADNGSSKNKKAALSRCTHTLSILTNAGTSQTAPSQLYIETIFDSLSSEFETRLTAVLKYNVPNRLYVLVNEYFYGSTGVGDKHARPAYAMGKGGWIIGDLGCGSGLCGREFYGMCYSKKPSFEILESEVRDNGRCAVKLEESNVELEGFAEEEDDGDTKTMLEDCVIENREIIKRKEIVITALKMKIDGMHLRDRYITTNNNPNGGLDDEDDGVGAMYGCDLSEKMCLLSRGTGVYTEVKKQDLTTFLQTSPRTYDLLLSADTFIYVGDLHQTFLECKRSLTHERSLISLIDGTETRKRGAGGLAFSIELIPPATFTSSTPNDNNNDNNDDNDNGYKLLSTGRYGHTMAYIETLCEEFEFDIVRSVKEVLRNEGNVGIEGVLFLIVLK